MVDESASCGVDGVIITGDLDRRPSRAPDHEVEARALTELAEAMSMSPGTVLQRLVDVAMELTRSDSAGISLLEPGGENGTFRWVATAGAWSPYRDGTMPRESSPCGEVIAREAVLLMKNPERSFPALLQAEPGIGEGLLAPFHLGGVAIGTVWTIKHSPDDHFEAEDARVLKSLARFASAAHQMEQALRLAEAAGQKAEIRVQQLVALADISTEFIGTCDMEFMPIYGNPAAMRMVGLTDLEQVKRTPLQDFVFPEDLPFITDEFIPRVLREGQAKVEIRFRHFVTGEAVWVDYSLVVLKDDMGRATGLGTVTHDLTERKRAETARMKADQNFTRLFKASPAPFLVLAPDTPHFTIREVNDAYLAATMRTRDDVVGRGIFEAYPDNPSDATIGGVSTLRASLERVLASRQPDTLPGLKYDVARPDGTFEERWWSPVNSAVLDDDGEVEALIHNANDVTEERRGAAALRHSEERFRQFSDASTSVLWIRDAAMLRMEFASPAFDAIYGIPGPERGGDPSLRSWARLIEPESRKAVLANFRRVRAGERVDHEFQVRRATDGALRWIHNTDFPLRDITGDVRWVAGLGADITEVKETADRQGVLVAELQHRTRNLIAVVRSLADRTLGNASSLDDFGQRFRLRLSALSRVQGLLSHLAAGERVTFDEMLHSELAAHGATNGKADRVTLDGPADVRLRAGMVQTFALALHELATNAVKYGALASPNGHLSVRWHVEQPSGFDPARLHVEWRESGVVMPVDTAPARGGGYGRELIERALPYQLKAKTTYERGADGVCCTIVVPIARGAGESIEH